MTFGIRLRKDQLEWVPQASIRDTLTRLMLKAIQESEVGEARNEIYFKLILNIDLLEK